MVVKIFEHFLRTISVCTVSTLYVLFHLILQNLYESVGIFNLIFQMRIVRVIGPRNMCLEKSLNWEQSI